MYLGHLFMMMNACRRYNHSGRSDHAFKRTSIKHYNTDPTSILSPNDCRELLGLKRINIEESLKEKEEY